MFISNVRELMNKKKKTLSRSFLILVLLISMLFSEYSPPRYPRRYHWRLPAQHSGEDRGRSRREDETPV